MFRFEHTYFLWGLALVPLILLLFILYRRWQKNARQRFGENLRMQQLIPNRSQVKANAKFYLSLMAFIFIVIGLANPQIGTKQENVKAEGLELMVAIDVSNSMMAQDLSPDRLTAAKLAMERLIERLKSDRIGMIVFAGEAYIQLPLTSDYSAAKLFLQTIDNNIVPTQGTAIGAAIDLAINSFPKEEAKNRALIILTDGENHEDDAIAAAEEARKSGIRVFTVGMGSPSGAPIPVFKNGRQNGFRQDNEGNTVVSSLNEEMLQEIAMAGDGQYFRATNSGAGIPQIMQELSSLEKKEYDSKIFTDFEDRYQIFFGIAFFLLFIDVILSERKPKWIEKVKLFEEKES
ncbi:VWA domain-containing protein [Acidiluteibacter ferrifornacis]|uniref:VWA domain-containing protein n=1 Tax=Acidiluteibacter ferrifornacis TaxID=2692424 RepID=A0A6N9NHP9_9FLAO|nr:VWA domain-containing protein [Acidiluteibacter ferrifornacis]MBR9832957.1 VWA domain-containing protein [bacterium]NBG65362.1 VWA domain-containing protein [Acidiluteibacter ferrifornacis]